MVSAYGVIRDMVYLGMYSRYLVELDSGGDMTVVAQNIGARQWMRGQHVKLAWKNEDMRQLT
jgi:ABC-type Fe3+/spermidine/putrescine transport system ATPase subunit